MLTGILPPFSSFHPPFLYFFFFFFWTPAFSLSLGVLSCFLPREQWEWGVTPPLTTLFGIQSVNGTLSGENVNLVNSPQLCHLIRGRDRESKVLRDVPAPTHSRRVIDNNISNSRNGRDSDGQELRCQMEKSIAYSVPVSYLKAMWFDLESPSPLPPSRRQAEQQT